MRPFLALRLGTKKKYTAIGTASPPRWVYLAIPILSNAYACPSLTLRYQCYDSTSRARCQVLRFGDKILVLFCDPYKAIEPLYRRFCPCSRVPIRPAESTLYGPPTAIYGHISPVDKGTCYSVLAGNPSAWEDGQLSRRVPGSC